MFSWPRGRRGSPRDLLGHGAHLFVDQTVGGEDDGAAQLVRIAGKSLTLPPASFDQEDTCGDVPFRKAEFPEAIEAAARHGGEVQGSGAVAAHAVRVLREVAVVLKMGLSLRLRTGKPVQSRLVESVAFLETWIFLAVEGCAFAAGGGKELIVKGIEDRRASSVSRWRARSKRRSTDSRAQKFVVPSSGSTCQRNSEAEALSCPVPSSAAMACSGKYLVRARDDEFL